MKLTNVTAATKEATTYLDAAAVLVTKAIQILEAAGVSEDDCPDDDPIAYDAFRLLQNAKAAELHTTDYFGS